jgi:hypothetical protein
MAPAVRQQPPRLPCAPLRQERQPNNSGKTPALHGLQVACHCYVHHAGYGNTMNFRYVQLHTECQINATQPSVPTTAAAATLTHIIQPAQADDTASLCISCQNADRTILFSTCSSGGSKSAPISSPSLIRPDASALVIPRGCSKLHMAATPCSAHNTGMV